MKKLYIVTGPPCGGKTTYVRRYMKRPDVVFDYDAIQNALCYGTMHNQKPHLHKITIALREKFVEFCNCMGDTLPGDVWIIATNGNAEWLRQIYGFNIERININPGKAMCLELLYADTTRIDKDAHKAAIEAYFSQQRRGGT